MFNCREWLARPKVEKFAVWFTAFAIVSSVAALIVDLVLRDGTYWFQRSGALLTLAGIELQYARLFSVWRMQLSSGLTRESAQDRITNGKGVSLMETAQQAEEAKDLAQSLYNIVTGKSSADVWSVWMIIFGTLIWAFADLPFKT